jgi:hypothetical protein
MGFFGFLLIFAVIIGFVLLFSAINVVAGILKYIFTLGGHIGGNNQGRYNNGTQDNTQSSTAQPQKHKILFDKSEAEDVDYEEVKENNQK